MSFTFVSGFIYATCVVIFGWLIHKLSGIDWSRAMLLVIVLDVLIRGILNVIARRYLARHRGEQ